uniref:Essential MCU regulator, mitochondrial n=1 Tax=Acrobeloides nanus TaxID=290746 RepID=A0A914CSY3_9BILA
MSFGTPLWKFLVPSHRDPQLIHTSLPYLTDLIDLVLTVKMSSRCSILSAQVACCLIIWIIIIILIICGATFGPSLYVFYFGSSSNSDDEDTVHFHGDDE